MHYLLIYETTPEYLERRGQFRGEHLRLAWQAHERGELVLAGAVGDPPDGAILFFEGPSPEAAEEFAKADPYVRNGLIRRWNVKPWATVVGERASSPVRP